MFESQIASTSFLTVSLKLVNKLSMLQQTKNEWKVSETLFTRNANVNPKIIFIFHMPSASKGSEGTSLKSNPRGLCTSTVKKIITVL